ncbi:hypothetical protein D3C76_1660280 [compost metagenome]
MEYPDLSFILGTDLAIFDLNQFDVRYVNHAFGIRDVLQADVSVSGGLYGKVLYDCPVTSGSSVGDTDAIIGDGFPVVIRISVGIAHYCLLRT